MNDVQQVVTAVSRKQEIAERFATEERIGTVYSDDEPILLPNGKTMFSSYSCAEFVVDTLGEGEICGFFVADNPSVTEDEVRSNEGHDFAVIEGRYIVDFWVHLYAGITDKGVFDLQDPADAPVIAAIYGDPSCWSRISPDPRPRGPG